MKIIAAFAIVASLLCAPVAGNARGSGLHGIAVGMQGVGSQWTSANPTMRWRIGDSGALDFTPSLSYSGSPGHNHTYDFRVEVGWVCPMVDQEGVELGVRAALAYGQAGENLTFAKRVTRTGDLSTGLDLEYFVPGAHHLSIGAEAVVRYRYSSEKQDEYPVYDSSVVQTVGQIFTIRYYFR